MQRDFLCWPVWSVYRCGYQTRPIYKVCCALAAPHQGGVVLGLGHAQGGLRKGVLVQVVVEENFLQNIFTFSDCINLTVMVEESIAYTIYYIQS